MKFSDVRQVWGILLNDGRLSGGNEGDGSIGRLYTSREHAQADIDNDNTHPNETDEVNDKRRETSAAWRRNCEPRPVLIAEVHRDGEGPVCPGDAEDLDQKVIDRLPVTNDDF